MNQAAWKEPYPAGNNGVHPLAHAGTIHQFSHEQKERYGNKDEPGVHIEGLAGHDVPQGWLAKEEEHDKGETAQRPGDIHAYQEEGTH